MFCLSLIIIIILILIYYYFQKVNYYNSFFPKIYNFYNDFNNKHFFIIGSQHGNEPAPCLALSEIINDTNLHTKGISMTIVPCANPMAIKHDLRSLWYYLQYDINRTWIDYKQKINEYIIDHIINVKKQGKDIIVIDFHEAWGFHECTDGESLGQTIYSNNSIFHNKIKKIINNINININNKCMKWKLLQNKELFVGSLEDFCNKNKLTYILVETAGQNNIINIEERKKVIKYLFHNLIY